MTGPRAAPDGADAPPPPSTHRRARCATPTSTARWRVDANGRLVVAPDLRRFFEYFFIASGEESDRADRRPHRRGDRRPADGRRRRATRMALLERFLRYRERAPRPWLATAPDDVEARARRAAPAARARYSATADAAALFADEDALFAAALAERQHPRRSVADRRRARRPARRAATRNCRRTSATRAPPAHRAARDSRDDEAALRAAGGVGRRTSSALREQAVGTDAADRLAALDQQRAAWQARVDRASAPRSSRPALDRRRRAALDALRAATSAARAVRIDALDCTRSMVGTFQQARWSCRASMATGAHRARADAATLTTARPEHTRSGGRIAADLSLRHVRRLQPRDPAVAASTACCATTAVDGRQRHHLACSVDDPGAEAPHERRHSGSSARRRASCRARHASSISAAVSVATMRSVSLRGRKAPQGALGERDRLVEAAVGEQGVAVAQLLARARELVLGEPVGGGVPAGLARPRARGVRRGCARRWRRARPAPSRAPTRDGRRPRS